MAFILDVLVADGELIQRWSEEKGQYTYHKSDITSFSQSAI